MREVNGEQNVEINSSGRYYISRAFASRIGRTGVNMFKFSSNTRDCTSISATGSVIDIILGNDNRFPANP
jgi:hypothetical protein